MSNIIDVFKNIDILHNEVSYKWDIDFICIAYLDQQCFAFANFASNQSHRQSYNFKYSYWCFLSLFLPNFLRIKRTYAIRYLNGYLKMRCVSAKSVFFVVTGNLIIKKSVFHYHQLFQLFAVLTHFCRKMCLMLMLRLTFICIKM